MKSVTGKKDERSDGNPMLGLDDLSDRRKNISPDGSFIAPIRLNRQRHLFSPARDKRKRGDRCRHAIEQTGTDGGLDIGGIIVFPVDDDEVF